MKVRFLIVFGCAFYPVLPEAAPVALKLQANLTCPSLIKGPGRTHTSLSSNLNTSKWWSCHVMPCWPSFDTRLLCKSSLPTSQCVLFGVAAVLRGLWQSPRVCRSPGDMEQTCNWSEQQMQTSQMFAVSLDWNDVHSLPHRQALLLPGSKVHRKKSSLRRPSSVKTAWSVAVSLAGSSCNSNDEGKANLSHSIGSGLDFAIFDTFILNLDKLFVLRMRLRKGPATRRACCGAWPAWSHVSVLHFCSMTCIATLREVFDLLHDQVHLKSLSHTVMSISPWATSSDSHWSQFWPPVHHASNEHLVLEHLSWQLGLTGLTSANWGAHGLTRFSDDSEWIYLEQIPPKVPTLEKHLRSSQLIENFSHGSASCHCCAQKHSSPRLISLQRESRMKVAILAGVQA